MSRSFAALLDESEHGQTIVITRGGRRLAAIGPAKAGNGVDVMAVLSSVMLDDDFSDDGVSARQAAPGQAADSLSDRPDVPERERRVVLETMDESNVDRAHEGINL